MSTMLEKYRTIDLFAGIGGMRLGFEGAGFDIVYSNDVDPYACQTYLANFGEIDDRDIRNIDPKTLPQFDVLLAGFPCQPFSNIGARKGLNDPRGQLFKEIIRFLNNKKPRAFVLENVKNLLRHDRGETYKYIKSALEKAGSGYDIFEKVLDSKNFGIPQHRERVYIVGIKGAHKNFLFPTHSLREGKKAVRQILEKNVADKYYLSQKYYEGLLAHKKRHAAWKNGFGCQVLDINEVSNTIVCGNMGRERNLIQDRPASINKWGVRKLTERECARLQGFPDEFKIPVSLTQAYKQFGNAVSVPVAREVGRKLKLYLRQQDRIKKAGKYPLSRFSFPQFVRSPHHPKILVKAGLA